MRPLERQFTRLRKRQEWPSPAVISIVAVIGFSLPLTAAILPEDRADALYHRYDGGGVTIQGPSLLARKQFGESLSAAASYYIDSITSASIDVVTQGSPYKEERKEYGLSLDYLHKNTTVSLAYGDSKESDFVAKSYHFSISHGMFGDLTTVSLGYSRGADDVYRNEYLNNVVVGRQYMGDVDRYSYRFGLSQILSKKFIMNLAYDVITDEGYLNNPYRRVWNGDTEIFDYDEKYPKTHTTNAVALRGRYFMPYRAALHGEFRFFSDSWNVVSGTAKIGYSQPFKFLGNWILDFHYRFYSQSRASFYADSFPVEQVFMASDKELSTFTSNNIGVAMSYEFPKGWWKIDKGSINLSLNQLFFSYADFTDKRKDKPATYKQPYSFSANVLQFYVSIWY